MSCSVSHIDEYPFQLEMPESSTMVNLSCPKKGMNKQDMMSPRKIASGA